VPRPFVIGRNEQRQLLRGGPNGTEFISNDLEQWVDKYDIQLEFIQPGNPQKNAYVERYNRIFRYSWLSQYQFDSITEVLDYATQWLCFYNNVHPTRPMVACDLNEY